jgi:hypothetical protein
MAKKRRMTALEFETVRPLLGISAARIEAARAALVDGKSQQAIADAHGWTARQTVGDAVDVVWNKFAQYQESQRAAANFRAQAEQEQAAAITGQANAPTGQQAPAAIGPKHSQ